MQTVGLFYRGNPTGYFTRFGHHLALTIGEAQRLPFQLAYGLLFQCSVPIVQYFLCSLAVYDWNNLKAKLKKAMGGQPVRTNTI